ncbi:unnamed protein product [Caenorhabditis brenneri]
MCLGHGADVLQEMCVEHKVEYSTTDASILSGDQFEELYNSTTDITYKKGAGIGEKCDVGKLTPKIAALTTEVYSNEKMRTEGAYTAKDRAINLFQILCNRVSDENKKIIQEHPHKRRQLYQALFKEKLVVEDTKAMTEQSGLFAFLMMPRTCASFLQHFEYVPTQKECHRLIMEASHRDDTESSRLIGLRVEERINCGSLG